jgi:lysophospholipase L1-like esterase
MRSAVRPLPRSPRLVRRALLAASLVACAATRAPQAAPPPPPPPVEVPVEAPPPPPPRPDHALRTFFEALAAAEAGDPAGVDVLHLGASHTAADALTGRVRLRLQERFGDAGRGYAHPTLPDRYYRQEGMSWAIDGAWTAWRANRDWAVGPFGVGGIRLQGEEHGASWTRSACASCATGATFDAWSLHYLDVPGGGAFRVLVDGAEVARADTALPADEVARLRATAPPPRARAPSDLPTPPDVGALRELRWSGDDAAHEVKVELVGDGPVSFLGLSTTRAVPGVRYAALGIEGSRADQFLTVPAPVWEDDAALVGPELIVLHWGINDTTLDRYWPADRTAGEAAWIAAAAPLAGVTSALIDRLRATNPAASCLILLPTDLARRGHPAVPKGTPECVTKEAHPLVPAGVCMRPRPPSLAGVQAALRDAAARSGCATWDQQHAMGGPGSIDVWRAVSPPLAATDGIHLTFDGYRLLADALALDLIEAWDRWMGGEAGPPALDGQAVDLAAWVQPR